MELLFKCAIVFPEEEIALFLSPGICVMIIVLRLVRGSYNLHISQELPVLHNSSSRSVYLQLGLAVEVLMQILFILFQKQYNI